MLGIHSHRVSTTSTALSHSSSCSSQGADELMIRWQRLKIWGAASRLRSPFVARQAHTISAQDVNPFEDTSEPQIMAEKSTQSRLIPSTSPTPSPTPNPINRSPSDHDDITTDTPISPIYQLFLNPTLFDPIRKPRNPIVLCHGKFCSYCSMRIHHN